MEKLIKVQLLIVKRGGILAKVLIATLYSADPVLLAATRLSAERLILLVDEEPDKEQEQALKLIKDSLGRVLEIKTVKIKVYDIVEVAKKGVEIIDLVPKEDEIYLNITAGRKTQAIGLLFAGYARCERIKKIAYNPQEDKTAVVYLPKLSFNLTESQKKVLEQIDKGKYETPAELAEKTDISTGMLYRNIKEMQDMDLITTENGEGFKLTDAGMIARL